jgi:hypothetical protein
MKRIQGLLRDTWWLWLGLLAVGTLLAIFVSEVFVVTYPICLFAMVYFGLMRYDDEGNHREV